MPPDPNSLIKPTEVTNVLRENDFYVEWSEPKGSGDGWKSEAWHKFVQLLKTINSFKVDTVYVERDDNGHGYIIPNAISLTYLEEPSLRVQTSLLKLKNGYYKRGDRLEDKAIVTIYAANADGPKENGVVVCRASVDSILTFNVTGFDRLSTNPIVVSMTLKVKGAIIE